MPASTAVVVDTNQTVELVPSCEAIPVQAVSINELHSSSEELNELTSAVQMPTAKKQSNIAKLTSGSTIEEMIRLRNLKTSQNITESVPVPSSEHVAEIVGRQGCKIKALRAKTNTYIKTPIRGEQPQFVITGRKEDVITAKREIQLAADHFSQIRARRGNGANTPIQGQQMIPSPCHTRQGTPTPPINTPCKTNSVSSSSSSSISLSPPAVHKINTLSQDLASSISPKLTEGVPDQLINSLDTNELHSSCTLIRQQTEQVMQLQPGQIITKVCVPYQVVGLVVGPRGTTIKRIQQNTNTYIITPSRDSQPVFAIQGLPDNVAQAKIEIENYIQLRTNTSSGQGHLLNGYNSCSSSSSTSSSVDPSGYFQSNSTCGGANTIGSFSSNDYEFFSNGLELMDDLKLKNNTLLQESSIWSSPANTFGAQSDDCLVNSIQQNLNPTLNSLNGKNILNINKGFIQTNYVFNFVQFRYKIISIIFIVNELVCQFFIFIGEKRQHLAILQPTIR